MFPIINTLQHVSKSSLACFAHCMQGWLIPCCVVKTLNGHGVIALQIPALSVRQTSLILAMVLHTRMTYHPMQIEVHACLNSALNQSPQFIVNNVHLTLKWDQETVLFAKYFSG